MLQIVRCQFCKKEFSWAPKETITDYGITITRREYLCKDCYQTTNSETHFNFCSFDCLRKFANAYEKHEHKRDIMGHCETCNKYMLEKKEI